MGSWTDAWRGDWLDMGRFILGRGLLLLSGGEVLLVRKSVYVCDVCGREKQQTNHWWIAYTSGEGFHIDKWRDGLADNDECQTLCGQECVIQAVNKYLSGGK